MADELNAWWTHHFGREITPGERMRVVQFARTISPKNPFFVVIATIIYSTTETLQANEQALTRLGPTVDGLLNTLSRTLSIASHTAEAAAKHADVAATRALQAQESVRYTEELIRQRSEQGNGGYRQSIRLGLGAAAILLMVFISSYMGARAGSASYSRPEVEKVTGTGGSQPSTSWGRKPSEASRVDRNEHQDLDR
jgi:hypothetical protein